MDFIFDRTFCVNKDCKKKCDRKLTDKITEKAKKYSALLSVAKFECDKDE